MAASRPSGSDMRRISVPGMLGRTAARADPTIPRRWRRGEGGSFRPRSGDDRDLDAGRLERHVLGGRLEGRLDAGACGPGGDGEWSLDRGEESTVPSAV